MASRYYIISYDGKDTGLRIDAPNATRAKRKAVDFFRRECQRSNSFCNIIDTKLTVKRGL